MKKQYLLMGALAIAGLLIASGATAEPRHAILVGLNNYDPAYGPSPLFGCSNDVTLVRDNLLLKDRSNRWNEANITTLFDGQATKAAVRQSLQNLAAGAEAGALVFYQQSSHGGTTGGTDSFLCMYDANYTDAELAEDLALFSSDVNVVLLIDACHSGGLFPRNAAGNLHWPFAENVMKKYVNLKSARLRAEGQPVPKSLGENIAFMTAANFDETCWDFNFNGTWYGLFTYYFVYAATNPANDVNNDNEFQFWELYRYASLVASAINPGQTAQIYNYDLLRTVAARSVVPLGGRITVNITHPVMTGVYETSDLLITLGGTVFNESDATEVTWWNNMGGNGVAVLTTEESWTAANIPLSPGNNTITVMANNGLTLHSDSIVVTFIPPPPLLYIEMPTSAGTYSTDQATITLAGAMYSVIDITNVVWQNDRGGYGSAEIQTSESWIVRDIALARGNNVITLTAYDEGTNTSSSITVYYTPSGILRKTPNDFNGNGKSDLAVYDPHTGNWFIRSIDGEIIAWANNWGIPGPVATYGNYAEAQTFLVAGDYKRDFKSDLAVFDKPRGKWYVKTSQDVIWGVKWTADSGIPAPGDYSGDGKVDLAIFEPLSGLWKTLTWTGVTNETQFGWYETIPVANDYSGDGKTDLGVYHPATGSWYIEDYSVWGGIRHLFFGWSETEPVPGDYDGDGRTDPAVYHQASGTWHILTGGNQYATYQFGWHETVPVPGDYNGDGRTDLAVYHQPTGTWYIWMWDGGLTIIQWGWHEATPVVAHR